MYLNYNKQVTPESFYIPYTSNQIHVITNLIATLEYMHYFLKQCTLKPLLFIFEHEDIISNKAPKNSFEKLPIKYSPKVLQEKSLNNLREIISNAIPFYKKQYCQ